MHSAVMNDYILDTATGSNTDWVLTFPVKREFVNATTAGAPFTAVMTSTGCVRACAVQRLQPRRAEPAAAAWRILAAALGLFAGHGHAVLGIDRHQRPQRRGSHHGGLGTNSGVLGSRNALP
jgi:hypothetical protein